ncbi:hypothetical protein NYY88_19595, partial [Acinetobacter baumannii]|nr:hypothetical protein [Acinetobacter baumannii]
FGIATAHTAYGACGVKVWIFKGEILEHDPMASERRALEADASGQGRRDDRRDRDRDREPRNDRGGRRGRGRDAENAG